MCRVEGGIFLFFVDKWSFVLIDYFYGGAYFCYATDSRIWRFQKAKYTDATPKLAKQASKIKFKFLKNQKNVFRNLRFLNTSLRSKRYGGRRFERSHFKVHFPLKVCPTASLIASRRDALGLAPPDLRDGKVQTKWLSLSENRSFLIKNWVV